MKNLKNKIILSLPIAALVFTSSTQVHAQSEVTPKKIEIGIRFMPTFTSLDIKSASGGTIKGNVVFGYGAGAILGFNFNQNIGIQGEVIYSSISQKYSEVNVQRKINLQYLNIPLLLSLNTGKMKMINLNIVAGPQIAISTGSSVATSGDDGTATSKGVLTVKKSDFGIAYGAGLDFGINEAKTFRVGIGFRGVYGLLDISDHSRTVTTDSYYLLDRTHIKTYSGYIGASFLF